MVLKQKKKQKLGFPIEDFGNDGGGGFPIEDFGNDGGGGLPIANFGNEGTDNEEASPLIIPQKRQKHKKINTTRRKTPPRCHS